MDEFNKEVPWFYTSDYHFGHDNIIKYCGRPFKHSDEMNTTLLLNWNKKVPEEAVVFMVGDVIFGNDRLAESILPRLNGEKILILGNHDREHRISKYFSKVYRMMEVNDKELGTTFLCHYPIESWPGMNRGVVHLHGHCHGGLKRLMDNRMDVGVDCHPNYEPFSSKEIKKLLKRP